MREQTAGLAALALEDELFGFDKRITSFSLNAQQAGTHHATPNTSSPMLVSGFVRQNKDENNDSNAENIDSNVGGSKELGTPKAWAKTKQPLAFHRTNSSLSNIFGKAANQSTKTSPSTLDQSNKTSLHTLDDDNQDDIITEETAPLLESQLTDETQLTGPKDHDIPSSGHINRNKNPTYQTFDNRQPNYSSLFNSLNSSSWPKLTWTPRHLTTQNSIHACIYTPTRYIPTVIVNLLLNLMDGFSFGMILFPVAQYKIFEKLGPVGLSMFLLSCVISQLVVLFGPSESLSFGGGSGGEIIQIVPFYHIMATTLVSEISENQPKSILATTILAYAVSSILTGLVFFVLGYSKLGALMGFFPRHILVGCIGGVGWFLVMMGIEVSLQIKCGSSIPYTWKSLNYHLFQDGATVLKWMVPLGLALLLVSAQKLTNKRYPLLGPIYYMSVFLIFHTLVACIPQLSCQSIRESGWLFPTPTSHKEQWWYFYKLYDFSAVDYFALLKTVPAMLALTCFGILRLPIQVTTVSTEQDCTSNSGVVEVDVDSELLLNGISNVLSGCFGSIQNYLVTSNSVSDNSRVPGFMLALATFGFLILGPRLIGFIPVLLVSALLFQLGLNLLIDALYDTWGRVSRLEYFTILVIVITIGLFDFVIGIIVGLLLACLSLVIQASQTSAIRASYTGTVARSTVRRNIIQQLFLSEAGDQIFVLKLSGNLFFGTIVQIEQVVRGLLGEVRFMKKPIRYLVLDLTTVTAIDFSASEAFARMKRLLDSKNVFMLISGVLEEEDSIVPPLRSAGIFESQQDSEDEEENIEAAQLFPNLNSALEWSENQILTSYYYQRRADYLNTHTLSNALEQTNFLDIPMTNDSNASVDTVVPPRAAFLQQVADRTLRLDPQASSISNKWQHFKPPLPILMHTFQHLIPLVTNNTNFDVTTFWFKASRFFKQQCLKKGTILYTSDTEATGFYIVESGILRAEYEFFFQTNHHNNDQQRSKDKQEREGEKLYESIMAGTTCGELPFFSQTCRTATVKAEVESIVWVLDKEAWRLMRDQEPDMAIEFFRIALKLTVERVESMMAYILISASG